MSDASGSGNNATLGSGALAPAWVMNGLAFTYLQSVSLPSALNSSKTLCSSVYMTPVSLTVPPNQYPSLITSSLGAAGLNLLYVKAPNYQPSFAPSITAGGANTTLTLNLTSGYHDMCYVLGTGGGNLDHVYIDGQEVTYTAQGSSFGYQSSGNLLLGTSGVAPFTASGFNGTYYRFVTYSTQLTAAQVAAVSVAMRSEVASRGVAVTPSPAAVVAPQLIAVRGLDHLWTRVEFAGAGVAGKSDAEQSAGLQHPELWREWIDARVDQWIRGQSRGASVRDPGRAFGLHPGGRGE